MKRIMNKIDYDFWWEKIADYAKLVGRTTARPVLLLYYVLRSPETPSSDKMLIVAALSYLILRWWTTPGSRFAGKVAQATSRIIC